MGTDNPTASWVGSPHCFGGGGGFRGADGGQRGSPRVGAPVAGSSSAAPPPPGSRIAPPYAPQRMFQRRIVKKITNSSFKSDRRLLPSQPHFQKRHRWFGVCKPNRKKGHTYCKHICNFHSRHESKIGGKISSPCRVRGIVRRRVGASLRRLTGSSLTPRRLSTGKYHSRSAGCGPPGNLSEREGRSKKEIFFGNRSHINTLLSGR